MFNANKGKACIISIPEFDSETGMHSLDGYNTDEEKLKHLWHQLGYKLFTPADKTNLTAQVNSTISYVHNQFI